MYNLDYFEIMLRNNSATAENISKIRWKFIESVKPEIILDYGSGVGWFRTFRPKGIIVDTFDIGNFPQTGINHKFYDLVTMWDVLEHIPSIETIKEILNKTTHFAFSIPVLPKGQDLTKWKHYKPFEHLHYFTEEVLLDIINKLNFEIIKKGTPENPPRQDVMSFLCKKKN